MKKSLIALLLVVALVVTVSVFAVSAEEPVYASDLTVAEDGATATGYCPHCTQDVTWTKMTLSTTAHNRMDTPGHYFLGEDVTSGGAIRPNTGTGDFVYHLNGHTYTRTQSTGAIYPTGVVAKIFIVADTEGKGTLKNTNANGQVITLSNAGCAVTLYSGNLVSTATAATSSTANAYGGIIGWPSGSKARSYTFTMYGGTLSGGFAYQGGAIYNESSSTKINIYGGTIENCKATDRGGAICTKAGTFTMTKGTIKDSYCWGTSFGGNIYCEGGTLNISGGTISGGSTTGTANQPSVAGSADTIYGSGRGGNLSVRGSATLNLTGDAMISGGVSSAGGNVSLEGTVTRTLTGGTITGGHALNGGNIVLVDANASRFPGLKLNGTTVSDGTAYVKGTATGRGGNIYNLQGSLLEIAEGSTVSGGTVVGINNSSNSGGGGNIFTLKPVKLSGGTVTGGSVTNADGGNIYCAATDATLEIASGTITKGTALRESYETGETDETTGEPVVKAGFLGQGGNIFVYKGSVTMSGGTVSGGLAGDNAVHAGNIYLGGNSMTMTGGTVTGGKCSSYGGNIYLYTNGTIEVSGDAAITKGEAAQGGNLYVREATATITGADVNISGGTGIGNDIRVFGKLTDGALTTRGTVILDGVTSMWRDRNAGAINVGPGGLVEVKGETEVNSIRIESESVSGVAQDARHAQVLIKEGFTGQAFVGWSLAATANTIVPGADVPNSLWQETGYVGTGTVKALNNSGTSFNVVDGGDAVEADETAGTEADNKFSIAAFGGFKADADGKPVETPLGSLEDAADYEYVRLYAGGNYTLPADILIDMNNQVAHFITDGHKLSVMEYRSNGCNSEELKSSFTVDDADNLERYAVDPIEKFQYVVVGETVTEGEGEEAVTKTVYTANRVQVSFDSVSIKPQKTGMYYTTKIGTNAKVMKYALDYGVVLSLVDEPGSNFLTDDSNGDGKADNLYTAFDFSKEEKAADYLHSHNSALLSGMLPEYAFEQNGNQVTSATAKVYANAYVSFQLPGESEPRYIMADTPYELSLMDVLEMIDDGEDPTVLAVLETDKYPEWQEPMAGWLAAGYLENYKATKA